MPGALTSRVQVMMCQGPQRDEPAEGPPAPLDVLSGAGWQC